MDFDLNMYPGEDFEECSLDSPTTPPTPTSTPPPPHIDLNQHPEEEEMYSPIHIIPQAVGRHLPNKNNNFSSDLKRSVIQMLLQESTDGKLLKGAITKVVNHFSISRRSVSRLWHDTKMSIANNNLPDVSSKLVNKVGRKRVEIDLEAMKSIPLRRRTNIRSVANALGLSRGTVHRRIKEGNIRPHSNVVKPYLRDENKKMRLEFCLSMIDKGTVGSQNFFFNMYDRIHIDEKWFYMSKTSQKYYLHADEPEPLRSCQSKRFIPKIMFLAAVARPRFDATANREFNGKIGIWPFIFIFREPAKRNSKNRVAGTLETKPVLSVTKNVIRSCLLNNLLPAIKEKWPSDICRTIFIQQDNARPHIDANDDEFLEAVGRCGLDIRLCCQPPNSPDLNVLDLGFFRAIDSIQHEEAPTTVDEFVSSVEKAFDMFPSEDLNNVFLTLQTCMVEILKDCGGNNYKIPHMNKKRLIRNEQLPICIECDAAVLNDAEEAIHGTQVTQHPLT